MNENLPATPASGYGTTPGPDESTLDLSDIIRVLIENRWLILVSQKVDTVPFLLVGFFRRVATDPMFFALGYLYGDRAVRWVERRFAPGCA